MADAPRDGNYIPAILGVSTADGTTTLPLMVDPLTGRLLVKSS